MEAIMSDKRKAYEDKFNAKLDEWSAQVDLLKAKANVASADAKVEYYKSIDNCHTKKEHAKTKMHELKLASDEAWKDVKNGAGKAWDEVETAFHEATSKFK